MTIGLHHVTLTSGEQTLLTRDGVSNDHIALLAEMLDGVLLGGVLPAPGANNLLIDGSHYRDDLKLTLWRGPLAKRVPLLTIGVARGPSAGLALWRELHRSARLKLATDTAHPPAEPWIADRPEPATTRHTPAVSEAAADAAAWAQEWLPRLGWTWVEYGR